IKTKCYSKRNDIAAVIRHTLFSVFNEENLDRIDSNISSIKLAEWKSSLKTKAAYEELFKDQQILLKIGYTIFKQYENKELSLLHCAFILSICDILLNPKSLSIKCNDKSVMRHVDAFLRAFKSKKPITPQIILEIAEAEANELKNQKSNNENKSFSSSIKEVKTLITIIII
ncbi:5614_t:CDS:2, partial [Gigaspora rosea]